MMETEQFLVEEFAAEMKRYPQLSELVRRISDGVQILVLGGWCRDRAHSLRHGDLVPSRSDVDIVVNGDMDETWFANYERTQFGGFRIRLPNGEKLADFWPLKETFAFAEGFLPASVNNLLKSTVFDVNSIAFDINAGKLLGSLALQAIDNRRIGLNCTAYLELLPDLQAYRGMAIARKLGYEISPELRTFIQGRLSEGDVASFAASVRKSRKDAAADEIRNLCESFLRNHPATATNT